MQHWFIDLYDRFSEGQSKASAIALSLSVVTLAACLSLGGSGRLSLFLFCLISGALVAWPQSIPQGLLVSLFSAILCLVADLATGQNSHGAIVYLNALARLLFFVMMTFILVAFRTTRMWARTDYLTGIANRRGFSERVAAELQRSRRHRRPVTLAYLDIDNFKAVNDRFGHNMGDRLLCMVANTLQLNLRREDAVSRQGGDEFAILFVETGGAAAKAALNRIHSALLTAGLEHNWAVTFSIGAITYEGTPPSVDVLIQRADELMYLAKRTRNKAVLHVETDSSEAISTLTLSSCETIPLRTPSVGR